MKTARDWLNFDNEIDKGDGLSLEITTRMFDAKKIREIQRDAFDAGATAAFMCETGFSKGPSEDYLCNILRGRP